MPEYSTCCVPSWIAWLSLMAEHTPGSLGATSWSFEVHCIGEVRMISSQTISLTSKDNIARAPKPPRAVALDILNAGLGIREIVYAFV